MSGGSFDYAYFDAEELAQTLEDMVEFVRESDAPEEAATELAEVQEALTEKEDLMYAVEWYASGDWGPEKIREEL